MKTFCSLTLAAVMGLGAVRAFGQISLVTDRASFPTDDTVTWSILGPAFATTPSSFSIATTGGSTVAVSHDPGPLFERRNEGLGWGGNFLSGEALLWNRGDNGAMTFDPANLISGAGFNVMSDYFGAFTFRLDAFDSGGGLLGSVTEAGNSNNIAGTAIFIGFIGPLANVDRFVATLVSATNGPSDFAINTVALSSLVSAAPPAPPVVPVPEPATYGWFGALAVLMLAARRGLRRTHSVE